MNLIERYIFGRAAKLTVVTLVAATFVVLITQILVRINLLTTSGQSLATVGKLALTLIPSMLLVTLPFAVLIGVSQVLSQMNADSELAVLEGAGGSPAANVRPVVALGLLASLLSLGAMHLVEPYANRGMRDIVAAAGADLIRIAVQSGSFKKIEDNLFIQIAEEKPGGAFGGLFIADLRDDRMQQLYYAKQAAIVDFNDQPVLLMADGEMHRKNRETGEVSIIRFQSYAVDFNQFGAANKEVSYLPKERGTIELLWPVGTDYFTTKRPDVRRSEIHRRFSEWTYPLAFALIAAYFAGSTRSNRQERMWSIAAATVLALVIRGGGFFTTNVAGSNVAMAVASYVVPAVVILVFGWLIVSGRQLRVPQKWVDRASSAVAAFEQFRLALQLRLRGYPSPKTGGGA